MKNSNKYIYLNNNQVIVNKLFPADSMPTAVVYSSLLGPEDNPIIRYPKYMLWQRLVILPYSLFEERLKSLRDLVNEIDNKNQNPGGVMREEELIGFESIEDIKEILNPELNDITSEELRNLRKDLEN